MVEVYNYSIAILIGVAMFGAVLGGLRFLHAGRLRSVRGVIRRFEDASVNELKKFPEKELHEAEAPQVRPSLYGIPYLAWILASLVIPMAFLILFFENLIAPYPAPSVGTEASIAYRAPAAFQEEGQPYERHQLLVRKGKLVTESDRRLVVKALANRGRVLQQNVLGILLILTIFIFILLYHINILYPTSTEKNRNLVLICLTILTVVGCSKLALFYELFSPYLIPVPWAGMMITILINRRIVPLIMLVTLIFVSLASGFDFGLFLVLLSGGLVSGSWVRGARRRSDVMLASMLVGVVMVVVLFCESMVTANDFTINFQRTIATFGNGAISGLLTLIILPVFEVVFDFASPFRLMELLNLDTPILKEFFFKAPGSYQHSMAVANIAESVANELGANGLLVRVGAYYHDIGKMFNPRYFVENQSGDENLHEQLGPVASAAAVRSHVSLGIELARQIGLPGPVADFIPEHHGTSTIDYFYHKSRQLESAIKSERVFKYSGRKPQSRETAIVMIVDSVEAAARVLETHDEKAIRELVDRVARRKLDQGEFDESGLTIGELKRIVDVLAHILKSTRHSRIQYPSGETTETKQGKVIKI